MVCVCIKFITTAVYMIVIFEMNNAVLKNKIENDAVKNDTSTTASSDKNTSGSVNLQHGSTFLYMAMWASVGLFGIARFIEVILVFSAKFWVSWNKNFVIESQNDIQIDDDKLRESLNKSNMTY
jgi:hypothetical protein